MKKDEIIAFLQQLVESQNRQIDDLLRQVASLTDEVASLKVLLVQKGEEEEKTKRALKVLGKLNRNKSEKQTPPAQETETPATTIIQQRKSLMAKRRDRTPTTAPSARFTTISRQ